jgi:acyl carrier protein
MKHVPDEQNEVNAAAETIQEWIIARLAQTIGVELHQIDPRLPLTRFGLDSLAAFNLTGDLADWLGRDLPATLLWDHQTIASLSQHLADGSGELEHKPSL